VIRPWWAGVPPDWRTRGSGPGEDTSLSALVKRWKSPTAASTVTAVIASTLGMVIKRRTTGSSNASAASRRSTSAISAP